MKRLSVFFVYVLLFTLLIFGISALTSCSNYQPLTKVEVLSTVELPRSFVMNFQYRVVTKDSIVYCYYTNNKYESGDKILLDIRNGKIY
jgi:hypothetical protein